MASLPIRRLLIQGSTPEAMIARIQAYGVLDPQGDISPPVQVRAPVGDWLQIDLPPDLPLWHVHNLTKWIEGGDTDAPPPPDAVLISEGEGWMHYWLSHAPGPAGYGEWLSGSTAQARPLQVHVPSGMVFDVPQLRVPHTTPGLALLSRGVPAGVSSSPILQTLCIPLGAAPAVSWHEPPLAHLEDGFPVTTAPQGGLWATVSRLWRSRR